MSWAKGDRVSVWLRDSKILKEISFSFESNLVAIYGKTGAGKTTLMHAMLGVIPDVREGKIEGKIEVLGRDPRSGVKEMSKVAALLLQEVDHNLFGLNVMDELIGIEERIDLAKRLRIEDLLDREISSLSYGEKQKVAIAACLLRNPEALFLDEPLAHLDVKGREELEKLLYELSKERKVFVVEHRHSYFKEAERYEIFDGKIYKYSGAHHRELKKIRVKSEKEILKVKELSASLGSFELKDITFSLREGEVLGVAGLNGSGKTTLGKALAGLIPFKGKVKLRGKEMKWKELRGKVGYMSQNPDLQIFTDKVRKEIELTAKGNVEKIMKMLDLEKYSEKDPHALSKGERLKVVAGALLASGAEVVILDEVTAGQDPLSIYDLVKAIAISGKSVLLITHEISLIRRVCERALILRGGEAELVEADEVTPKAIEVQRMATLGKNRDCSNIFSLLSFLIPFFCPSCDTCPNIGNVECKAQEGNVHGLGDNFYHHMDKSSIFLLRLL